jgi:hypothetical protein
MKNTFLSLITGFIILAFTGCAPVNFYSNAKLTEKAGLKYYNSKPYLLVERDIDSGRITNVTVIYLPDLANPQYMVVKGGLGSKHIELGLTDGSIKTFGSTSDTKIPETITSLSKLATGGADAISGLKTQQAAAIVNSPVTTTELYEVIINSGGTSMRKVEIK